MGRLKWITRRCAPIVLAASATGQVPTFKPCATDPAYKEFERIQYAAYAHSPAPQAALNQLFQNNNSVREGLAETQKKRDARSGSPLSLPEPSEEQKRKIIEQVATLKVPTCYESRPLYFSISERVAHIEKARKELGLALTRAPKFGSLPTADVNAYTYPTGSDAVIGFNAQLMQFDNTMSKLFVPTIWTDEDAFWSDRDFQSRYISSILGFLSLTPIPFVSTGKEYDLFTSLLLEGMELFAVGHEYGHIIKKHVSATAQLRLGPSVDCDPAAPSFSVQARSWQQELEADQVGVQLLIRALQDQGLNPSALHFTLKSVLFYFECQHLLEGARYLAEGKSEALTLSASDEKVIEALADGQALAGVPSRSVALLLLDHPPSWLRMERVQKPIDQFLATQEKSDSAQQVTDRLLKRVNQAFVSGLPQFEDALLSIRARTGRPMRTGCADLSAR